MSRLAHHGGIVVGAVVLCLALSAIASIAQGDLWEFENVTILAPDTEIFYEMSPPISTAFPRYDWSYNISSVEAQLAGLLWVVAFEDIQGSGQSDGGLPFDMWVQPVDEDALKCNLRLWVNENGNPHFDVTDIVYGQVIFNNQPLDVTGLRVSGSVEVTGVPEPSTIVTFLIGALGVGLIFVRRRKR